jgi:hypothetical protein
MPGHLLGVLEPSVVPQVNRDAGCPPGMTSDRREKARRLGSLSNRSPGVVGFTARPVTAVPRELTFWKGVACSGGLPDPLARPAPFRFQVNRPKKDCRMRFSRRLKVVNR